MTNLYNHGYYHDRFNQNHLIHKWFISLAHRREPIFRLLKCKKPHNSKLLDIGCGEGTFLRYAHDYFECSGCDISKTALAKAQTVAPNANLKPVSAYDLKRYKNQFDVITCFDAFEHLLYPEKVLPDIYQLLKPDGIFVFSMPNFNCISRSLKWQNWFGFSDPTHLSFYSVAEWEGFLKQAGFVPMKRYFNGLMDPPYLSWLPNWFQVLVIKYPTQALSILGFPIPESLGELAYIIAIKNPGFQSPNYKLQQRLFLDRRTSKS